MTREELIVLLSGKYPGMFLRTTEEFDGCVGGIWTSGEDTLIAKDGKRLFSYYATSPRYELGIHREIYALLEKHGWYCEWYDPGTIMIWEC